MRIFKQQASLANDSATSQRVLINHAQHRRVLNKTETNTNESGVDFIDEPTIDEPTIPLPPLQVEYPPPPQQIVHKSTSTITTSRKRNSNVPVISQDNNRNDSIQFNTRADITRQQARSCTLTQDFIYNAMEFPTSFTQVTPQQAARLQFPLQYLLDQASQVLDDKTGNLLEYHRLMRHPKYKDVWSQIQRLATTTETLGFKSKSQIPQERHKDITYGCIACAY